MGIMAPADLSGDSVLIELRAREAFGRRDYQHGLALAKQAAVRAHEVGDETAWWQMTLFQAECQRGMGDIRSCIDTAEVLREHPITLKSRALECRILSLLSDVCQAAGELERAVRYGIEAVKISSDVEVDEDLRLGSLLALIASLAESDELEQAWQQCLTLVQFLGSGIDSQTAGKGYWVIGNVAFLRQQADTGIKYHKLAAEHLSPLNDLALWAWFNRASASMRLSAGVADTETEDCMERAELAASIIGEDGSDRFKNRLNRANWHVLNGELEQAVAILVHICTESEAMGHQTAGEANLLLGKALREQGDCLNALRRLKDSQAYFSQAGAKDRAAQVAAEIAGFPQAS
jgi:tetratricopeptide (TPR) repeat protein